MSGPKADPSPDADVARFADFLRQRAEQERARRADVERQRRDEATARRQAEDDRARLAQARDAKDRAVRRAKELRARRAPAPDIAAADAEYRAALADLEELETGRRPAWAPATDG